MSILGALAISAVFGLMALTGCDTPVTSGAGIARFSGETVSRLSEGDYFDAAIWQTINGGTMSNRWDFTAADGTFTFYHYMNGKWEEIGTYKYTLRDNTLSTEPDDIGGPFTIAFNSAKTEFIVDPEPIGMGGTRFVKQPRP
jgi:hypothetical protein